MFRMSFLKNINYKQYLLTISASLSSASVAVYVDWCSPALLKLTKDEEYAGIKLTTEEASWLASSLFIGGIIGCLPSAWLLDVIGRKKSLLVGGALLLLPWIALSIPISPITMMLSRVFAGCGTSFILTNVPTYLGEIADKNIRGKLTVINVFISTCGHVVILGVGPFVSYLILNALCASFPALFICTFLFAPESPYYLMKIRDYERARRSLSRLIKNQTDVDSRFLEIKDTVEIDLKNTTTFKELIFRRDYRKSIGYVLGLKTLHHVSGMFAINAYMQTIVGMTNSDLSAEWVSVMYGLVQLPAVLLSAFLVDNLGRKPLLAISSFGVCVCLTTLATYCYLIDVVALDLTSVNFLPAACLLLYVIMMSVGIIPLPFVMFGELFTTNVKAVGGLMFMFYGSCMSFIIMKMFNTITENLGIYTIFWIYAGCCFLGTLFSIFLLPETKKKSFAEIQKKLNEGKKNNS